MAGTALIWMVNILFLGQVVFSIYQGQYPQALIMSGYIVANAGLIWSLLR